MDGRIGQWIYRMVAGMFCVLMAGIFWATLVIDKNFPNLFPNTVRHKNMFYYMAAACLGIGLWFLYKKIKISSRLFYIAMVFIFLAAALVQWKVSTWMLVPNSGGDFGNVMGAAISLADGGNFQEFEYFKRSPNNANIAIFLSFLYRIFPDWQKIIFCGALFTNLSVIVTCLAIRNISHSNEASLFFTITGEVLVALTWRAFLAYTDNFGMLFTALAIWVFTQKLDFRIKVPVFLLVVGVGSFIKITNAILLLAVGINQLLTVISAKKKEELLKFLYSLAVFAAVFGALITVQGRLRRFYLLEPGEYAVGWQYMFMVGQNTDCYGVVNGADSQLQSDLADGRLAAGEVKRACFKEAASRIISRGAGNLLLSV